MPVTPPASVPKISPLFQIRQNVNLRAPILSHRLHLCHLHLLHHHLLDGHHLGMGGGVPGLDPHVVTPGDDDTGLVNQHRTFRVEVIEVIIRYNGYKKTYNALHVTYLWEVHLLTVQPWPLPMLLSLKLLDRMSFSAIIFFFSQSGESRHHTCLRGGQEQKQSL